MTIEQQRFTIGMEEEYFVVDRDSRDLVPDLPEALLEKLLDPPIGATSPEFIRSQIEIGTPVCTDISELSDAIRVLRTFVSETVSEHNMAIIAASTHPFAKWGQQRHEQGQIQPARRGATGCGASSPDLRDARSRGHRRARCTD